MKIEYLWASLLDDEYNVIETTLSAENLNFLYPNIKNGK